MAIPNPPLVTGAWLKDSAGADISVPNPLPVEQIGSITVTGPLTSAQLAAAALATAAQIGEVQASPSPNTVLERLKAIATALASVPVTGPLTDTQLRASAVPVSGTITTTPPANASTNVAQIAGTTASVNSGNKDNGTQRVVLATDQPTVPVSGTFYQATQPVSPTAATSGGANPYHYIAAASAACDAQVIKASAGQIFFITGFCLVAAPRFLKVYTTIAGAAPASTDTPVLTLPIPANGTNVAGFVFCPAMPVLMTGKIAFRLTTGVADNDTGACSAGDCVVDFGWI